MWQRFQVYASGHSVGQRRVNVTFQSGPMKLHLSVLKMYMCRMGALVRVVFVMEVDVTLMRNSVRFLVLKPRVQMRSAT